MPARASDKPKSSRAGGYHVRTGCITCKIRHVKCDEEKPACLKCRSTGRDCDGYRWNTKRRSPIETPKDARAFPFRPASSPKRAVHDRDLLISPNPSLSISGTTQERQCFEFFRCEVGKQLYTAMLVEPTHHFILQACHSDDAVKSAVVAIGSMGQRLRINHVLTSENQEANAFQDFAQLQYCKALNQLRVKMSTNPDRSVNLATISCFLFTIFEFLQGNEAGSLVHLRSGLSILSRENSTNGASPGPDLLRQEIIRIFSIMDLQATMWLGLRSFQFPCIILLEGLGEGPYSLSHFTNIPEAAWSLRFQISRMYHFRRSITAFSTSIDNIPPNAYARRQDLLAELKTWPAGVDALLNTIGEVGLTVEIIQRVTVMQVNYRITCFLLTACLQPPEEQYGHHGCEADFRQIIALAKSVVSKLHNTGKTRVSEVVQSNSEVDAAKNEGYPSFPLFSFFAGIIQPLYIIAIHCRDLSVCREAVSLLSTSPWREGAWDSASMARIAERKIRQLEGEGYYDDNRLGLVFDLCIDLPVGSPFGDLKEEVSPSEG